MPNHNHSLFADLGTGGRDYEGTRTGSYASSGGYHDASDSSDNYILSFDANYPTVGISSSTGGDQPHNIMPPYYSLAYVMKL